MTELSPDLHHHDASLDDMDPTDFRVFFSSLDAVSQKSLAADLQKRFTEYGKQSITHHDQAALGLSADLHGLDAHIRARRERIGNVLVTRERRLNNIKALLTIALSEVLSQ